MTELLNVARSGYYAWVRMDRISPSQAEDERLLSIIKIEFQAKRETYGSRRMSKRLSQKGTKVGRFWVK